METYIVWFGVFLKQQLKNRLYRLQLLLLFVCIFCVASIRFPNADNCRIGYCYNDLHADDWLKKELNASDEVLVFCFYDTIEELYDDVSSGKLDCGFVLPKQLKQGSKIESVQSPMSTKTALAGLSVFDACYHILSEDVLTNTDQILFENRDPVRLAQLLQNNREIRESDRIFHVDIKEVSAAKNVEIEPTEKLPVQGMAGLFVIMIMLLANGIVYDPKSHGVFYALSIKQRKKMRLLYSLTSGVLPALAAVITISCLSCTRGFYVEALSMGLLICWTALWIILIGCRQTEAGSYHIGVVLFLIAQVLICPVFTDVANYIPAFALIRQFLPLGIYLYY